MSTSRHQNTDGQSENAIRLVEEVLRGRLNYEQDNWVSELSSLEFALNNSVSQPLGMTPFYCETGRNPIVPIDLSGTKIVNTSKQNTSKSKISVAREFVNKIHTAHASALENLIKAQARMTKHADDRRRTVDQLIVGGKCYLRLEGIELAQYTNRPCSKLNPLWYGPLEILDKISPVSYKIKLPARCRIHDVFHVDRLKAAHVPPKGLGSSKSRSLPTLSNQQEYEVEAIVDEKLRYKRAIVLIKWKGYSELYDNSWEPLEEIQEGAPRILKKWRKDHPELI